MNEGHKLFQHWKSDPAVLNQYFESVVANYKVYDGDKSATQIYKSHALYKQAIYGDCSTPAPENLKSKEGHKWKYWDSLRGMPQEMAKRRFITYLSEINPALIDVVPCEEPPIGFPTLSNGTPICAKCNTKVGCSRVLYDQRRFNLKQQLFDNEELSKDPVLLKEWALNALQHQRCIWGAHQPIPVFQARQHEAWFNRIENKGFVAYDCDSVFHLLRDLVYYHHQLAYDMMQHKDEYTAEEYNVQAVKTFKIKDAYDEVTGEHFVFELPCTSDTELCNLRRKADRGINHNHEVKIDMPTKINLNSYEDALKLKNECLELGIDPSTGVISSIEERCTLLRDKIAQYHAKMARIEEARGRLLQRPEKHVKEKRTIRALHDDIAVSQCSQACDYGDIPKLMRAVSTAGDVNQETARGITPLICLVLNNGGIEHFEVLAKRKANFNSLNKFGKSPLIYACILGEVKLFHCLLKNGASPYYTDTARRTPLHWCALQSNEDGITVLLNYVTEAGGSAKDYVNLQDKSGETALFTATKNRNGLICKLLCSLGADFLKKNAEGKSAIAIAREKGFYELADWLDKRVGSGVIKLESNLDIQFERTVRYGAIKLKDYMQAFVGLYTRTVRIHPRCQWFTCASHCSSELIRHKETITMEQRSFVNAHAALLSSESISVVDELRVILEKMATEIKDGKCNPNTLVSAGLMHWSPLMCATLIGDTRLMRVLCKEGANINLGNMHGVSCVMLTAWVNNVDAFLELLQMGADHSVRDNEGYSAQMYSSLLPPTDEVQRSLVDTSINGNPFAVKKLTTADLFVIINKTGTSNLRDKVDANRAQCKTATAGKTTLTKLMERQGLTRVDDDRFDLHAELRALNIRMGLATNEKYECVKPKHEIVEEAPPVVHRCNICTLPVPCRHFTSVDAYLKATSPVLVEGNTPDAPLAVVIKKPQSSFVTELNKATRVYTKPAEVILQEVNLGDRNTDRNLSMVNEYRDRVHKALKPMPSLLQITDARPASPEKISLSEMPRVSPNVQKIDGLLHSRVVHVQPEDAAPSVDNEPEETTIKSPSSPLKPAPPSAVMQTPPRKLVIPIPPSGTPSVDSVFSFIHEVVAGELRTPLPRIDSNFVLKSALKSSKEGKPKMHVRFTITTDTEAPMVVAQEPKAETISLRNTAIVTNLDESGAHPAPVSPKGRSVYLFTKDRMSGSGMREGTVALHPGEGNETYETVVSHAVANDPLVLLSGWLFVNLNDTEMNSLPLKDVFLSFEKWACILTDTIAEMNAMLSPLSHRVKLSINLEDSPVQCLVCRVGFCRTNAKGPCFAGNSAEDMGSLCLPCVIRRSLFEKVKILTSDEFQRSVMASWPALSAGSEPSASLSPSSRFLAIDDAPVDLPLSPSTLAPLNESFRVSPLGRFRPTAAANLNLVIPGTPQWKRGASPSNASRSSLSPARSLVLSPQSRSTMQMDGFSLGSQSPAKRFLRPGSSSELSLVPMLLSKGHHHDAESFLRITHFNMHSQGKYDVLVQTQILMLQAEMYKLMGIWPLAIALYLDVADLLSLELGAESEHTKAAVVSVVLCLKLTDREDIARVYLANLAMRLKKHINIHKIEVAESILTFYRLEDKRIVKMDSLGRRVSILRPRGHNTQALFEIDGLGGLYNMMALTEGFPIVCRLSFLAFCDKYYDPSVCHLVDFAIICFKLRACQNISLQRTLNQQIIAKFLSKTLLGKSVIAQIYNGYSEGSEAFVAIKAFSKHGVLFTYDIFVDLLLFTLQMLMPMYRRFFYSPSDGYLLRVAWLEAEADAYHLNANIILTFFRKFCGKELLMKSSRKQG